MDLYGDLPPTNDGKDGFVSASKIKVELSASQKRKIQEQNEAENKLKIKTASTVPEPTEKPKAKPTRLQFAPTSLLVKPRKNIPKASTVKTGVSTPKGKTIAADTKPLGTKEESVNSLETKAESNHKPEGLSKSVEDKSDKRIEKTVDNNQTTQVNTPIRRKASFNLQDVKDEYDPSIPNNYELYLEHQAQMEIKEANDRRLREQMKIQEEKMRKLAQARKRDYLHNSGEGAETKEGRGRGRAMLKPAW
eukprot:CAMPEP_0184005884 /NCGR_PEP_ID=MMETSP0954-20121128/332_1 /TAXON_ID=627963 /ORGANISM="Aplanochytrium sp, Strain PBS07" /LENGTH=248 /DNA_ID=CAMNT_0026284265 /DNA_START=317 /DNA_END=1060 /DNA_ORIENTATION=-